MFDKELRDAKSSLNDLKSKVERLISSHESNLKAISKDYQKVDGYAEKEIDSILNELENNVNKMIKEFKKSIEKQESDIKKEIDDLETNIISYLKDYKENAKKEFDSKITSFCTVRGEL